MVGKAVVREQKINDICALVQKEPGKHFSINSLASKIGSTWNTTDKYVDILVERDSANYGKDAGGLVFYAVAHQSKTEKPDANTVHDIFFGGSERKGMDRMPLGKNESGCSDPTVAAILSKERQEEKKAEGNVWPVSSFKPGDIWAVSVSSSEMTEEVVVLAVNKQDEKIVCCPYSKLYPRAYMNISTKPVKYFKFRVGGLPISLLAEHKAKLREFFEIEPEVVEKEVVKEVKVEVPVEVEKIVEKEIPIQSLKDNAIIPQVVTEIPSLSNKEYTKAEVDMLLAEQKAEIYEKCFNAIAMIKK